MDVMGMDRLVAGAAEDEVIHHLPGDVCVRCSTRGCHRAEAEEVNLPSYRALSWCGPSVCATAGHSWRPAR